MNNVFKSVSGIEFKANDNYLEAYESGLDSYVKTCPSCGVEGLKVLKSNVGNHVDYKYWNLLDNNFWFCPTSNCNIVYYNNRRKIYFLKNEVNVPVFHKEKGKDRPVCYCFNVTEQMIWDEIYSKKCCNTLEDIIAHTKAGSGRWCPITNPSGRCCREYLEPLILELLGKLPEKAVEQGRRVKDSITGKAVVEPLRLVTLKVYGMTCEGCAASIRSILEGVGGRRVEVSFKDRVAKALIPVSITIDELLETIGESGYEAELMDEERIA